MSQVEEINERVKKDLKKKSKESETDLKCPHCNKLCSNKTGLANHIRLLHTKVFQETSICQYCGKQFKKQGMPSHMKKCQKIFPAAHTLSAPA